MGSSASCFTVPDNIHWQYFLFCVEQCQIEHTQCCGSSEHHDTENLPTLIPIIKLGSFPPCIGMSERIQLLTVHVSLQCLQLFPAGHLLQHISPNTTTLRLLAFLPSLIKEKVIIWERVIPCFLHSIISFNPLGLGTSTCTFSLPNNPTGSRGAHTPFLRLGEQGGPTGWILRLARLGVGCWQRLVSESIAKVSKVGEPYEPCSLLWWNGQSLKRLLMYMSNHMHSAPQLTEVLRGRRKKDQTTCCKTKFKSTTTSVA